MGSHWAGRIHPVRDGLVVGAVLFLTAAFSTVLLHRRADEACRAILYSSLIRQAQAVAALVDGDAHRQFRSAEQEFNEEYCRAVAPMRRVLEAVDGLRFVYTVILEDDEVYFVLDATPPGDADGDGVEDHSGIMELYESPDPAMLEALREGRATSTRGAYQDKWGSLISGFAPFHDSAGRLVGVVGVDITSDEYERRLASMRGAALWGLVPALLASVIAGLGTYWLRRWARRAELARQYGQDELRASEEYHRQIFESVPDAMLLFDVDGRIVDANPAACELHGYTHAEMVKLHGRDIVHPDHYGEFESFQVALAATGKFHVESVDVRRDGSMLDVEVHGTAVQSRGQRQLLAVVTDITARKRAARELRAALAAAEAANQSKSEFLANMSHEIRTPMTAILGFAETLLEAGLSEEERLEAVSTIDRNGRYLLGIINDILDLSKIEAGKLEIEQVPCAPAATVADVCSLMGARAREKGLTFEVAADGPVPRMIRSDPTRLRQILINLVGNAIKFTERGGVRVVVGMATPNRDAAPLMRFDVLDSGLGMSEEQVERLFRPFAQADGSTSRRFGGTGLGLAISRRLANGLGGDVWIVATEPGRGTHVRLTVGTGSLVGVELVAQPFDGVGFCAEAVQPAVRDPAELGIRILLAEDGLDNQRLISAMLRRIGSEVVAVENGAAAVEQALVALAAGTPFDVILMDMQMPEMDGYTAASLLRERSYPGAIIALTAHAMPGDRERCLQAGCNDYATKPIDRRVLIATLRRWAGERSGAAAS